MRLSAKPLTTQDTDAIVATKVAWILSLCDPKKIILFGSAARHEMTEASDIDLIVLFNTRENERSAAKILFTHPPSSDGWPMDLLTMTEDDFEKSKDRGGGACWIASREGRTLYTSCGL